MFNAVCFANREFYLKEKLAVFINGTVQRIIIVHFYLTENFQCNTKNPYMENAADSMSRVDRYTG
jgi:hypothetical protein